MKQDRKLELKNLANNLEIMLTDKGENIVAFTTDSKKFDVFSLITEIAKIYSNDKKVLILTYGSDKLANGIDVKVIDNKKDDEESLKAICQGYDIVLVDLPNIITTKLYLQLSKIVKSVVICVKEWSSKTSNITKIKNDLESVNVSVLGVVYQK